MPIASEPDAPQKSKPLKSFSTPDGLQLSNEQEESLQKIERARIDRVQWGFTLSGYAGTGKTTTLAAYVRWLVKRRISVAVSAPTNKATQVLQAAVGVTDGVAYGSIHKFLGLQIVEQENGTQKLIPKSAPALNKFQVIIVDECSMIPRWMMEQIMVSRGNAFIIFIGDPYQLAPINTDVVITQEEDIFSLSFSTLPTKGEHTLAKIVRQKDGHPIIDLSVAIRQSEANRTRFGRSEILAFMDRVSDPRICLVDRKDVPVLAEQMILESWETDNTGLPVRIVAWRNAQVETYNSLLHRQCFGGDDNDCPFSKDEVVLAHKEFQVLTGRTPDGRVISTRVFTSEECIILDATKQSHPNHPEIEAWQVKLVRVRDQLQCRVYVPHNARDFQSEVNRQWNLYRDMQRKLNTMRKLDAATKNKKDDERSRSIERLNEACKQQSTSTWQLMNEHAQIRHAYASTAHKAQGSTWNTVIVDLDDLNAMKNNSDYNRALYVAVTRASNRLVLATAGIANGQMD
ncbi:MAG: ATP-dependent DNA helicase [Ferrimicrobium acidiphilum]